MHHSRQSLHRCLQRNGIGCLPGTDGDNPARKAFEPCRIGFLHIDLVYLCPAKAKLDLGIAIDRTLDSTFARLVERADSRTATALLEALPVAEPHTLLTESSILLAALPKSRIHCLSAAPPVRPDVRGPRHRTLPDDAQPYRFRGRPTAFRSGTGSKAYRPSTKEWPSPATEPERSGKRWLSATKTTNTSSRDSTSRPSPTARKPWAASPSTDSSADIRQNSLDRIPKCWNHFRDSQLPIDVIRAAGWTRRPAIDATSLFERSASKSCPDGREWCVLPADRGAVQGERQLCDQAAGAGAGDG